MQGSFKDASLGDEKTLSDVYTLCNKSLTQSLKDYVKLKTGGCVVCEDIVPNRPR